MVASWRAGRAIAAGAVALGIWGVGACILADPPADLPVAPIAPPEIARASASPPFNQLLRSWPTNITVPVSADPRGGTVISHFLVDQAPFGRDPASLTIPPSGEVMVTFNPETPSTPEECHTLELDVSYSNAAGVDSIAWFYSLTGSFGACPIFDAGPGDAGEDGAGDDGSEGGD